MSVVINSVEMFYSVDEICECVCVVGVVGVGGVGFFVYVKLQVQVEIFLVNVVECELMFKVDQ